MAPRHNACVIVVCAIAALAAPVASAADADPCADGVVAFVSEGGAGCEIAPTNSATAQARAATKGALVRMGDEITCAADRKVTITFCASREDTVIEGSDGKAGRYIAPGVPHAGRLQDTSLAPAERLMSEPRIPTCDHKIGTIAIAEPEQKWWVAYNLESPEALIKVFVQKSNCFAMVDRGKGLASAQSERALAESGEVRGGSSIGKGQLKAADYVLVPDIVNRNANASGNKVGGLLGGMFGGVAGAIAGNVSVKSKTADVVLTLTDVRSTEQVALQEGRAKKPDLGWAGGGAGFFGGFAAAGASGYANTEIGQVVTMAYLDAFTRMVDEVKAANLNANMGDVRQSVTMAQPGRLYEQPDVKAKVLRELEPGTTLHPSGEKQEIWWKVRDELGNEGWVPSTLLQLAK